MFMLRVYILLFSAILEVLSGRKQGEDHEGLYYIKKNKEAEMEQSFREGTSLTQGIRSYLGISRVL